MIMSYTVYGKHTYAIGSNEEAARMSGINVQAPQGDGLYDRLDAGGFCWCRAERKGLTAQAGMGEFYELFAIAMAVIGGISLHGRARFDHRDGAGRDGSGCHPLGLYLSSNSTGRIS